MILLSCGFFVAAEPACAPVIIDTDIGLDIDDAFALALAVASPELEIADRQGLVTMARHSIHVESRR